MRGLWFLLKTKHNAYSHPVEGPRQQGTSEHSPSALPPSSICLPFCVLILQVQGEIQEVVKTGLWVGDCFIYTSSVNRLNYFVGGEIVTIAHLDRYCVPGLYIYYCTA